LSSILFKYASVLDVRAGTFLADHHVAVRDGRIVEVSSGAIAGTFDRTVAVGGKTLMPGLVDGHVHVTAVTADFDALAKMSPTYVAAKAAHILADMLMRGFTTVRDAAGADFGLARAVEEGAFIGPRILYCGHALSQTGGHGDMRAAGDNNLEFCFCCAGLGRI
jgi:imidazolonepropionase-like amidohydrolase